MGVRVRSVWLRGDWRDIGIWQNYLYSISRVLGELDCSSHRSKVHWYPSSIIVVQDHDCLILGEVIGRFSISTQT